MMSKFDKLSDIADVIDSLHKTPKYLDEGQAMVRCTDVKYGKLNLTNTFKVNEEVFSEFSRKYTPRKEDIIITRVGSYGITAIVDELDFCLGQNTSVIVPKDINPRYLYLVLNSPYVKNQIEFSVVGSTQKTLSLKAINNLEIPRFEPDIEDNIAKIGGELDDKIELNRQTNQTLEEIAQAVFKSWFVDFEPTRAKILARQNGQDPERTAMAAIGGKAIEELHQLSPEQQESLKTTAALFPDTLIDSELGHIPDGWEVKTFGMVSKCFDFKRVPLSKRQREEKKPGNIPYYGATSVMDYVNEWIFDDIYLLLGEDGSVIKEDGTPFVQYIWGKSWVNNHAHVLQGINGVSTEQLMLFIQGQNIVAYITGAVQLKLNQGNMNSIPFLDAGVDLNAAFFELIAPSYRKIRTTIEEMKNLEQVRDALLPKLLSGELVVEQIEMVAVND